MTTDDPFLWLEDVEGDRALDWVRAQNARSLEELEGHELFPAFLTEARTILNAEDRLPLAGLRGGYAYNFWQDETHVRGLWRRMPISDYLAGRSDWDVLIDIDALATEEKENWVFGGAHALPPRYDRCLITLSRGGSDAAVKREFDIRSRSFVADGFSLEEAKSQVAWIDRDTLLIGTDTGPSSLTESGYPRTTRRWRRGTVLSDAEVVFEGKPEDVFVSPFGLWDGARMISGVIRAISFYESEFLIDDGHSGFRQLPVPKKAELSGYCDGRLIFSLNEDWMLGSGSIPSGSVVAFDPWKKTVSRVFEPMDRVAVDQVATSRHSVVLALLDNIAGRLVRAHPAGSGWELEEVPLPPHGVVSLSTVDEDDGTALATQETPTTPEVLFAARPDGSVREVRRQPPYFDASFMETRQFEAISRDGTLVPYFVTGLRSVLDNGPAPAIQYGYGGFQVSILPHYAPTTGKMWLERGGLYVIANIRGGGEFGPAWHQAGLKTARQKIYDDFFAVSEDLVARGMTTPAQLGILGGSNGGLLMGVALTQRPELYSAVGIGVPLLDMLRFDQLLAGASWVGEYGSPANPEERAFLERISPYHRLSKETRYPRPFFFTSTKDDRVHPGHARKMAARMEAFGHQFLYFENIEGGHGAAANREQQARRLSLQYAYFAQALGLGAE